VSSSRCASPVGVGAISLLNILCRKSTVAMLLQNTMAQLSLDDTISRKNAVSATRRSFIGTTM
jgi:hypothetical protein